MTVLEITDYEYLINVARKIAWKYAQQLQSSDNAVDIDDLVSAALEGAVHAAKKYDSRRGKFMTYAVWWMRHYASREITMRSMTIHVPEKKFRERTATVSLDEHERLASVLASESDDIEEQIAETELYNALKSALLSSLTEDERRAVELFALGGGYAEIGRQVGTTCYHVKKTIENALSKLRTALAQFA